MVGALCAENVQFFDFCEEELVGLVVVVVEQRGLGETLTPVFRIRELLLVGTLARSGTIQRRFQILVLACVYDSERVDIDGASHVYLEALTVA